MTWSSSLVLLDDLLVEELGSDSIHSPFNNFVTAAKGAVISAVHYILL